MADEIRAVLAEVARLDREMVELRGKGDAGCIGNALRLAHKAPRLAAALAVAVGEVECWPYEQRGAHGQLVMPHPRAEHVLRRVAAALTEEAPL